MTDDLETMTAQRDVYKEALKKVCNLLTYSDGITTSSLRIAKAANRADEIKAIARDFERGLLTPDEAFREMEKAYIGI